MRVLDIVTGPGDVAFQLADLVGPDGSVTCVDRDPSQLAAAEQRRATAGLANVVFRQGDARTFVDPEPFDAVVGRLLLFHLPDAVDVIAHHARGLRPGGTFVAVEYDMSAVRALPPVDLLDRVREWLIAGFAYADADPYVWMRLPIPLKEAGLHDVETLGIQPYWSPNDPAASSLATDVVRALTPAIVASGVATEEELGLETLEQRVADAVDAAGAVWTTPTVVGCWGCRP